MDDSSIGVIILLVVGVISSGIAHVVINSYWKGCVFSTIVTVLVFHVLAAINAGYVDPFFIVSIFTTGIVVFVLSMIVGFLISLVREFWGHNT